MSKTHDLRAKFETARRIIRAPEVRIEIYGAADVRSAYEKFIVPHPRFRVQSKRWGVALLQLPDSFKEYLSGGHKQALRSNRSTALRKGYTYQLVPTQEFSEDILAINRSAPVRQGRAIDDAYIDQARLTEYLADKPFAHAVLTNDGKMCAYSQVPVLGDAILFARILGHSEYLRDGIMYLLVSEVIREYIETRRALGRPSWAMYDTYWGASPGLAYFKERTGFQPYRVRWVWTDGDA